MRANATDIKCHQCGQYGHLKRHCPENNNTVLKQDDDTKQKNRGRKGKYCSHHGKCSYSACLFSRGPLNIIFIVYSYLSGVFLSYFAYHYRLRLRSLARAAEFR